MARSIEQQIMDVATAALFEIEGKGDELFSIRDLQDEAGNSVPADERAFAHLRAEFAKIGALKMGESIEALGWKLRRVG